MFSGWSFSFVNGCILISVKKKYYYTIFTGHDNKKGPIVIFKLHSKFGINIISTLDIGLDFKIPYIKRKKFFFKNVQLNPIHLIYIYLSIYLYYLRIFVKISNI